jgi:MMPL family
LLLVFRSVVAALLPLMVGAIAVVGALVILKLLTGATDVAVYALNLTAGLGLGLAIDYSLFIVSRFREELAVDEAVVRTVRTAGRTTRGSRSPRWRWSMPSLCFPHCSPFSDTAWTLSVSRVPAGADPRVRPPTRASSSRCREWLGWMR